MVTQEQLDAVKAEVIALSEEWEKDPNLPVNDLVSEAADLIIQAQTDAEVLATLSIDTERVGALEARVEVLRDYQTQWLDVKHDAEEARKEWKIKYPEALELKKDTLQTLRFVYDEDEEKSKRISEITKGYGYDDLIQDLHDIAYMGKQDVTVFEPISYDVTKFDKADSFSSELMILLARMNGEKHDDNEAKSLRDKCFNYVKEIVDYIRKYGKYAFRNDPEKAKLYTSAYYK